MDASTIAQLVVFGPGAGALPVLARLWLKTNQEHAAERAVFGELTTRTVPTPPGPGIPASALEAAVTARLTTTPTAPAPVAGVAPVIDLATRRRRAA